jgi:hypothetical protein
LTGVNSNGNALYNVTVTPNTPPNTGALISGTAVLNTDGAAQGSFFAVARVPNSVTSAMDLIVADAANNRILRYPGPGPASYAVSTAIFTWSNKGTGPRYPIALAADVAGNVFVATAGPPFDNAALWVLPFNATTGAYGAPILVDGTCGLITEVVVATTSATPVGAAPPAWNAGDVLILANDFFNPRVLVYSQASIAGLLANPGHELGSPTSTAVASSLLRGTLPVGMDIWPADATHGVSLLLSTAGGRVMRFDSGSGAMTADFASGLGLGLERIKVGTYSTLTYAFVSQFTPGRGKILQFGAPPASGANLPLASLSTGNKDPQGLATSSSGSVPVTACVAPSVCAPLGPQLTTQLSGAGSGSVPTTAPLLEESCVVKSDPRVTVVGTTWSCAGGNLDVANYCPGFPSTVLPGSMCGHSGPTGAGFVVVKSTAKTVDQNANNIFFEHTVDPNVPLPGPLNLTCPQLEVFAWAPRSDLPLIEGTIPEGGPAPGSNYFMDLSGFCDDGGGHSHVLSMMAYGLGLNSAPSGMATGLPGFVTDKFTNLTSTIGAASAQIDPSVAATVQGYVNQAQSFFSAGLAESASNGFSCAMNSVASADAYVRANLPAFSGLAPPGNPNPAGDIDGRLANLFLPIDLFFLFQPANAGWPTNNVPPCVTLTPSPATVIVTSASPATATLTWGPAATAFPLSFPPTQCSITASDGIPTQGSLSGSGSVSTGPLTKLGTYSAELSCSAAAGNSILSFTQATINVIALASINVTPPAPQVAAGFQRTGRCHGVGRPGELQRQRDVERIRDDFGDRPHGNRHHHRFDDGHLLSARASVHHDCTRAAHTADRRHSAIGGDRQLLLRTRAASYERGSVEFQRVERCHGVSRRSRDLQRRRDDERFRDDHRHERQRQRVDRRDLPSGAAQVHNDCAFEGVRNSSRRQVPADGDRNLCLRCNQECHRNGNLDFQCLERRDRRGGTGELQSAPLVLRRSRDHFGDGGLCERIDQCHVRGIWPLALDHKRQRPNNRALPESVRA